MKGSIWESEAERALCTIKAAQMGLTDADRINALITLTQGNSMFGVGFSFCELFQDGRRGLDAFLSKYPHLLPERLSKEGGK